jgi:hypothetical protein
MIDALIKRISVAYECYGMYAHRGKKVQLLVFRDRSRNGRHLINYRHFLQANNLNSLSPYATDLTSDR